MPMGMLGVCDRIGRCWGDPHDQRNGEDEPSAGRWMGCLRGLHRGLAASWPELGQMVAPQSDTTQSSVPD